MTHTKPMAEIEGTFDDGSQPVSEPCRKCGGRVRYRVWDSSCGGYSDTKYTCEACGDVRWVDGADA